MFTPLSLFSSVRCPDQTCTRSPCPLSHSTTTTPVDLARLLGLATSSTTTTASTSRSSSSATAAAGPSILKRPAPANSGVTAALAREVKIRKVAVAPVPSSSSSSSRPALKRPNLPPTLPSTSTNSSDCPILNFLPNQTTVPLKDRQRALQLLFSAFSTLYSSLPNPPGPPKGLVAQHAMEQEQEGYLKGGKFGYKNALSNILISLRKRAPPTSLSHPSIGTQSTHVATLERLALERASRLSPDSIASLLLKIEDFETWGYLVEVPDGAGGEEGNCEGEEKECGRCAKSFVVPKGGVEGEGEEGSGGEKCSFHWGRKRWAKEHGVRTQLATCCLAPFNSPGCTSSLSHVFKETSPSDLHRRVGFKTTEQVRERLMNGEMGGIGMGGGLEVGAMDCEMFYSTCGMSVGRVTLLDEEGKVVLDEFVRPDPAAVLDLNTRFSGLHLPQINSAIMDLASVREALCVWVSPETTLVGHGLENDLLALRLVHRKVVDTAVIFPHSLGPPFRPALKDLASTYLQRIIQNSGDDGHSPEVDARTCLDLVKLKVREAGGGVSGSGSGGR
ncbi:hypothetical protein BDY24DRAFT_166484 [Mrakia frigida]|uniref:RNA exonuclease n=1 Tax=Mrakia frigida TaxID=29902 RepID=UPI003FCC1E3A